MIRCTRRQARKRGMRMRTKRGGEKQTGMGIAVASLVRIVVTRKVWWNIL